MTRKQQPAVDDVFIENAAASIIRIPVEVKRPSATFKVPEASRKAAIDAGADPTVLNGYVNKFGARNGVAQTMFRRAISAHVAVYNWLYANTFEMPHVGWGVVPVCSYPATMEALNNLKAQADKLADEFCAEYDRLRSIALADDLGDFADEVRDRYPPVEVLRAQFGITIRPFQPVTPSSVHNVRLPADVLAAAAEDQVASVSEQLKAAKVSAMEMARAQVERIAGATRYNNGMIEDAKRAAVLLRGMVEGYDNDPQVLALADLIDQKVLNVSDKDGWRTFPHLEHESQKAAATVVKELGVLADAYREQDAAAARAKFGDGEEVAAKPDTSSKKSGKSGALPGSLLADLF